MAKRETKKWKIDDKKVINLVFDMVKCAAIYLIFFFLYLGFLVYISMENPTALEAWIWLSLSLLLLLLGSYFILSFRFHNSLFQMAAFFSAIAALSSTSSFFTWFLTLFIIGIITSFLRIIGFEIKFNPVLYFRGKKVEESKKQNGKRK